MTQTNQRTSPHLRPHTADLNRLLAGEHHDPHSVLGAHEYDDHTVIRAYRPHAVEVVALVGGERYAFQHIEAGLFAVAVPFTNLVDYRLEVAYPGSGRAGRAHRRRRVPVPAHPRRGRPAPVRRRPPRAAVGDPGRSSPSLHHARRRRRRGVLRGVGAECQGRQPDRRVQPLGRQRGPASRARFDGRVGAVLARLRDRRAVQVPGTRRRRLGQPTAPTRWRSPPRCRRRRRRRSPRATTPGTTRTG